MLSNYSFPKTLKETYIDLDIIGKVQPNTEYALYITCDSATLTADCWCGFVIPDMGWSSNSVYYGDNTRYFILKTNENVNNSKFRIRGAKGVTINHIRLIKLVTNSKYSRIERFLYALYSLDSSDLPTPLSRIEELYSCLVTGEEAPIFEPLSRVEKYLMAILGVYDVDSLPNPLSRVEVLLYKLATGDDNLDDIKSFLSEHEELLAGIIRNGGINGDISFDDDYEYRGYSFATGQYTLENTAEQPVKSAILKGNTLVNSWKKHNTFLPDIFTFHDNGFMELNDPVLYFDHIQTDSSLLKPNTKYLLIIEVKNNTIPVEIYLHRDPRTVFSGNERTVLFAPKEDGVRKAIITSNSDFSTTENDLRWGVYIFFTQGDIPENERGTMSVRQMLIEYKEGMENWDIPYFEGMKSVKMPVLTTSNEDCTESNILTCNEEVELHGIGDVKDELNLLTGEVTQRVGEIVFDGSENWLDSAVDSAGTFMRFYTIVQDAYLSEQGSDILCDRFTSMSHGNWDKAIEGIHSKQTTIHINIPTSKLESNDASGFKKWLSSNPVTVCYRLATESVKTIDISTVDQDGNNTELKTFDNLTHVAITSEGLVPESEIEVAKYIPYMTYELTEKETTLYNTKEHSVKSAILKGNTLVNLWDNIGQHSIAPKDYVRQVGDCFKKSTKYLLKYNVLQTNTNNSVIVQYYQNDTWVVNESSYVKLNEDYYILTTPSADFNKIHIFYSNDFGTETVILKDIMLIEYKEGMENWDIPYFEGMKSVQMPVLTTTGKNLFNASLLPQTVNIAPTSTGYILSGYSCGTGMLMSKMFQNLIVGKKYVLSFQSSSSGTINAQNSIGFYNANTEDLLYYRNNESFILTNEMYYERSVVLYGANNETVEFSNVQLEEGSVATEYEPYKPTTVSCNEDVELRGIGEVKDELDLVTGEVTQRIGEYQITGEENWVFIAKFRRLQLSKSNFAPDIKCGVFACDVLQAKQGNDASLHDVVGTYYAGYTKDNWLRIILGEDLTSLEQGKEWLKANKPTIQYQLITESVKTVDISVVDQDGNDTELKTFDDITYVSITSEGLIPEAELEVATKNEEVLDTMSLRMDDISATQTTLKETSNTQSENVDATMIATTEIYEGLL